jgi:hypothetical protein
MTKDRWSQTLTKPPSHSKITKIGLVGTKVLTVQSKRSSNLLILNAADARVHNTITYIFCNGLDRASIDTSVFTLIIQFNSNSDTARPQKSSTFIFLIFPTVWLEMQVEGPSC